VKQRDDAQKTSSHPPYFIELCLKSGRSLNLEHPYKRGIFLNLSSIKMLTSFVKHDPSFTSVSVHLTEKTNKLLSIVTGI